MFDSLISLLQELVFFVGYVKNGISFPPQLSAEEEQRYITALSNGDENARSKLIEHNLRLVAHISKKYAGNRREMDDLISIGTIGLIKAVSTFNHKKGASLASYASKCIENEILMNIRAERKRSGEVSIQDSIGMDKDGNDVSLLDILGTEDTIVSDEVERRLDVAKLKQVMEQNLTKREYLVVRLRYGLTGGPGMPQRVVAQMLGISRSYVSRIEKKAIEKLTRAFEKENR